MGVTQLIFKVNYNQVQKFLRLGICCPLHPKIKQCCNNDSMPPGLLKWSLNIDCGERGEMINKKLKFMSKNLSK